jgi:hypothetical protein
VGINVETCGSHAINVSVMALIPETSPLRRVPSSLDRRVVLFLDGIRYSLQIFDLASLRLAHVLHDITTSADPNTVGEKIVAATADAWTMIDSIHRLRELLQNLPGLKQKEAELQVFLRKTRVVEDFRNFVQHFRSEIESFTSYGLPIWGTLSWAFYRDYPENHSIVPGTFFDGCGSIGLVFDAHQAKFVERVVLQAGPRKLDLATLTEDVQRFVEWYVKWFETKHTDENRLGADVHITMVLQPVAKPPAVK